MAKKIDITEKLNFDENPVMQIGTLEVEVNADAETMLRLMGVFGNKGELQAVEELSLIHISSRIRQKAPKSGRIRLRGFEEKQPV